MWICQHLSNILCKRTCVTDGRTDWQSESIMPLATTFSGCSHNENTFNLLVAAMFILHPLWYVPVPATRIQQPHVTDQQPQPSGGPPPAYPGGASAYTDHPAGGTTVVMMKEPSTMPFLTYTYCPPSWRPYVYNQKCSFLGLLELCPACVLWKSWSIIIISSLFTYQTQDIVLFEEYILLAIAKPLLL